MKIIWVLVNCPKIKEAEIIGREAMRQRLVSCFDIFPRRVARYFWPPKSGKIEMAKGCLLVLETMPKYFRKLEKTVRQKHSDKLPFIGSITIGDVRPGYVKWMKGEITN